jgi:uncharacterized protein YqeY
MLSAVLAEEIKKRVLAAMKSGNVVEKEVLRVALGEIQTLEARSGKALADEESAAVVKKLIKSNQETLGRSESDEQRATLSQEIAILESLLPKALGVDAIVEALASIRDAIRAAAGDGQATGVAMKELKARGDSVNGKDVAEAVKKIRAS